MVWDMNGGGYPTGWKLIDEEGPSGEGRAPAFDVERARLLHQHELGESQCTSALVKHINAPLDIVWSLVRRFDEPQRYKPFVKQCVMREGGLEVGSIREIEVASGLPATSSVEQLERLDDDEHILAFRKLDGDHRLLNYSSILTLHEDEIDERPGTTVVESFVVDVPDGNTEEETCCFIEQLIKCNLRSLANICEQLPHQ
ncbi:Abscisic acid receptor PYR1 [Rhynchospora pubera]|uniref:Abscisic acid receptor PYR1 n=1 Tax=Rhynchospora pubera TaxID=906938 RepID=A0AAV8DB05_9POAL|nr:Abscisic acid receptor PYR1 [Rhynchospora pubera]KAJ4765727.1 Abscisic acid receptor PYR1 [Rhynchospora pubera]